jgi:glycosyltransferase involved in cell wall biosynthesis
MRRPGNDGTPKPPEGAPLRVLYVNPFAQRLCGPDESLLLLLRHLGEDVQATVALPPHSPFRDRYVALGAAVVELPLSRIQRFGTPGEALRFGGHLARASAQLTQAVRAQRPDLIHCNMEVCLEAGITARLLRTPCVYHYRGNTLDEPKLVFDALTPIWVALSDRVFAISEGCADIFRRRGYGSRVEVLYNALALDDFTRHRDRDAIRGALAIPPDATVLLTVGRLHPRKDHETLLRAAAASRGPHALWLVAGSPDGPDADAYEARLRALASELGVAPRVRFLGARDDIPDLLAAADIFVMTSRHEGFGRAAAEAMAAGKPCVLTDEGAFPELVEHGEHGLLCPPEDAAAFAAAVDSLMADRGRRASMGEAGRRRAIERYDARQQARRVLEVYRSLMGRSGGVHAETQATAETAP